MDLFLSILKSVIYGVIEGITEWLPISSTGHMILAEQVLKFGYTWYSSARFWRCWCCISTSCGRSARIMAAIPALPPTCAGPWSGCGSKLL